ncbi:MAG: hypothetical protein PHX24_12985, partial [Acidithiobacillus sp.]|nr:hypothetical protein [Acidithiobacillus sp.]
VPDGSWPAQSSPEDRDPWGTRMAGYHLQKSYPDTVHPLRILFAPQEIGSPQESLCRDQILDARQPQTGELLILFRA